MKAAIGEVSPGWIRSPRTDCSVVSERTSFLSDLGNTWLSAGSGPSEPMLDVLSISDPAANTHGKTRLLSPRHHGALDVAGQVTILDGAQAFLSIPDRVAASVRPIRDPAS